MLISSTSASGGNAASLLCTNNDGTGKCGTLPVTRRQIRAKGDSGIHNELYTCNSLSTFENGGIEPEAMNHQHTNASPVYFVHYPVEADNEHQLTPLKSILKHRLAESSNMSSVVNNDPSDHRIEMSPYVDSVPGSYEMVNVYQSNETSSTLQYMQTPINATTYVDGGNFVNYMETGSVELGTNSVNLTHLPYITLTEVYPNNDSATPPSSNKI